MAATSVNNSSVRSTSALKARTTFGIAEVCGYLTGKKRYQSHVLAGAELLEQEHTAGGIMVRVKHAPMEKFRAVFLLKDRFVIADRGATQQTAITMWKELYAGASTELGAYFDRTCVDPSRLFFTPRHPKDAKEWRIEIIAGNVRANCPTCGGAITTYEVRAGGGPGGEYGIIIHYGAHTFEGGNYDITYYRLLRCAGCGRGGLAEIHALQNRAQNVALGRFFPHTIEKHPLPKDVPLDIKSEFEEAEQCAAVQAWRAASAMLRSVLEKALKASGYIAMGDNLKTRIDQAVADGILTEARSKRAHDNIRVLGNDVLHDAWREVTQLEFDDAHLYAQRILEDLYDDRNTVEGILIAKGRITQRGAAPP